MLKSSKYVKTRTASLGKEEKMKGNSESFYPSLFPHFPSPLSPPSFPLQLLYYSIESFSVFFFVFHSETQCHDFSLVDTLLTFYLMHFFPLRRIL